MARRLEHPESLPRERELLPLVERLVDGGTRRLGRVGVHVEGRVRLPEHGVQGADVVGVGVGEQDRGDRAPHRAQDLPRLRPGVHYDVALGRVDHVGVHLEAAHGHGYLLDLGQLTLLVLV